MKNQNTSNAPTSIISIINQKGGVGKSTVTTLLANIFYFVFKKRVAIIDADYPQQTIYKRHLESADHISQNAAIRNAAQLLYQDRPSIKIYPTEISAVEKVMDEIEGQFDFVFLDIAGTLNQNGIEQVLKRVHHFCIPVLQDGDTLKSSIEFYQILEQAILPHSSAFKTCHFFLNNLPFNNQAKRYRNLLAQTQAAVFQNVLAHHVVYERGFRSTLLPIPNPHKSKMYQNEITKLHRFALEVLDIVEGETMSKKKRQDYLHQTDTRKTKASSNATRKATRKATRNMSNNISNNSIAV